MDSDTVFIADYIKKRRTRNGKIQYLVKWKGCPSRLNTWEPEENILDPGLVLEFEERLAQEYRSGRPGRRPRSLMTVKEMKNRRRTLLAKVKQHRYLAELASSGNGKSNTSTENEKDISDKDENETKDVTYEKPKTDDVTAEKDANGNIPSLTSQNGAKLATKKPSYLSLDSNTNDLLLQPIGGNCRNVNSPLAGIVPSPTSVSSPKSATQPPSLTDRCPSVATANKVAMSPLSPNSATTCPGATRLPTPTNTIKQGKFALLRKYRNSLEERPKPKVCVTDVTVGDVTVAIHEGTSPKGFFRDRDGESDVFW